MTIFDEIASANQRLKRVKEKIELLDMMADSPKANVYSFTPKGVQDAGNPLERQYIIKEEFEERRKELEKRIDELWHEAHYLMRLAKIDKQTQKMMYWRFEYGLQWENCAQKLAKKYPDGKWTVNKCFRRYRDVLDKLPRSRRKD